MKPISPFFRRTFGTTHTNTTMVLLEDLNGTTIIIL